MLHDPRRLTTVTIVLTGLWLLGCLTLTALYLWQIDILGGFGGAPAGPRAVASADEAAQFIPALFILVTILHHIVFFRWVYVINRNAQQWSDAMTISPGWNVGWFFVPVACLWKPFEGIRESRGATIAPEAPESVEVPIWLRIWWGLWIAAAIYGNVTALILGEANTPEQWISISWMNAASIVIDLPLAMLTCRLLSDIGKLQSARIASEGAVPSNPDHSPFCADTSPSEST